MIVSQVCLLHVMVLQRRQRQGDHLLIQIGMEYFDILAITRTGSEWWVMTTHPTRPRIAAHELELHQFLIAERVFKKPTR